MCKSTYYNRVKLKIDNIHRKSTVIIIRYLQYPYSVKTPFRALHSDNFLKILHPPRPSRSWPNQNDSPRGPPPPPHRCPSAYRHKILLFVKVIIFFRTKYLKHHLNCEYDHFLNQMLQQKPYFKKTKEINYPMIILQIFYLIYNQSFMQDEGKTRTYLKKFQQCSANIC